MHSYDDYPGSLIRELVERLREWNCTVIILSATLTHELRNSLLGVQNDRQERGYPLLSVRGKANQVFYREFGQKKSKKVKISHAGSIDQAYDAALDHAEKGECVLWIENTVGDAQEVFRRLVSRELEGVEVLLLKDFQGNQIRPFGSDGPITVPSKNAPKEECTRCARILSQYLVRVYIDKAPDYSEYPLDTLSHVLYIGSDNKNRPLRAALVGDGDLLQNQSRFPAESKDSSIQMGYSARIGYFYERKENK